MAKIIGIAEPDDIPDAEDMEDIIHIKAYELRKFKEKYGIE